MKDCRSFLAFPTSSGSSGLCAWIPVADPYVRLLYRRLSAFQLPGPAPASLPASGAVAPFTWWVDGSRLPDPDSPATEAAFEPDLPQRELRPVFQPVEARASWRLSRGIASPSRVTRLMVRPAFAEPGPGDELRTTGASDSVLVPLHCLPAGRPSGRWVSSNGKFRLPPQPPRVNAAKSRLMEVR
jgi:hypothetical protein